MFLMKIRVPNYTEKHLVCELAISGKTLYADLTVLRDHDNSSEVPVYITNDISDMVLYRTMSRYELNEMSIY